MSKTIQEQILLNLNLKEGDRVKITHSVPNGDLGWGNIWTKEMGQAIGKEGKVISVDKVYGILLEVEGLSSSYSYPPQCVELVTEPVVYNKEKKEPEYYTFTDEFHESISDISPLRVGKGIVEKEDRYKCLFVIGDEYEPIIENKDNLKLIRLVKTNKHS